MTGTKYPAFLSATEIVETTFGEGPGIHLGRIEFDIGPNERFSSAGNTMIFEIETPEPSSIIGLLGISALCTSTLVRKKKHKRNIETR